MGRRCVRTHNTRTRAVRSPCSAGVRGRGVCCCLGCVSARVCVCPPASPVNPIFSIRFGDFRLFRFHFSHRPISGLSLPRGRTDGQTPSRSCRAPQPPSAPPALKGTVPPPRRIQASGPSAPFQRLVSSRRALTPGPHPAGGGAGSARMPRSCGRGWRPRVSRLPVTKAHCPLLLCGGGRGGGFAAQWEIIPRGEGRTGRLRALPRLRVVGCCGSVNAWVPSCPAGEEGQPVGPRHLGPEEPSVPMSLFPPPAVLIPTAMSRCPHRCVPPWLYPCFTSVMTP